MSPPQSDPEFSSVTHGGCGSAAEADGWENMELLFRRGWSSERRNKTTFLLLSMAVFESRKASEAAAVLSAQFGSTNFTRHPTVCVCRRVL